MVLKKFTYKLRGKNKSINVKPVSVFSTGLMFRKNSPPLLFTLDKERKFLRFEGVNFVYKYKMIVVVRKQIPMCEICGYPIEDKIAWWKRKKVCQFCFKTKTKGYHK